MTTKQAILDFAQGCGVLFDSRDGYATVTVDAAVLHEFVSRVYQHSRDQAFDEAAAECDKVAKVEQFTSNTQGERAADECAIAIRNLATKARTLKKEQTP